jgi:hypothetical protein
MCIYGILDLCLTRIEPQITTIAYHALRAWLPNSPHHRPADSGAERRCWTVRCMRLFAVNSSPQETAEGRD